MFRIRHIGVYVRNLELETQFYKLALGMHIINELNVQADPLAKAIMNGCDDKIIYSKLITECGKLTGSGDMLELIQTPLKTLESKNERLILSGVMHIGLEINNIEEVCSKISEYGGTVKTDIFLFSNGNKCCFCQDPEGNWLELIQR